MWLKLWGIATILPLLAQATATINVPLEIKVRAHSTCQWSDKSCRHNNVHTDAAAKLNAPIAWGEGLSWRSGTCTEPPIAERWTAKVWRMKWPQKSPLHFWGPLDKPMTIRAISLWQTSLLSPSASLYKNRNSLRKYFANSTCSSCYDTTGSSGQHESGGACAILGMTLSRMDLVFGCYVVSERCSATQGNFLGCLMICLRVWSLGKR